MLVFFTLMLIGGLGDASLFGWLAIRDNGIAIEREKT